MTGTAHRRIVTGLDRDGRSCILFDGPGGAATEAGGTRVTALWQSHGAPADNGGTDDAAQAFSFAFAPGASKFLIVEFAASDDLVGPGMHATDTLDYGMLLSGRISLLTETGEAELAPGDLVVDRGIRHGWRNRGPEVARMLFVNIDALPVGGGATVR